MNNSQLTTRLSVIAVIAGCLLTAAFVTALSFAEEADAKKKKKNGKNGNDGVRGGDGGNGGNGGRFFNGISQRVSQGSTG